MEKIMVRIAGYKRDHLNETDAIVVSKLASAILLAALVTGANSGIAAYHFFSFLNNGQKLLASIGFAMLAILIVLVIDRALIFFTDIRSNVNNYSKLFFLMSRIVFVLAIGSVTTAALVPALFKNSLEVKANQLSDKNAIENKKQLIDLYDVPKKASIIENLKNEKKRIENQINRLPEHVKNALNESESCNRNFITTISESAVRNTVSKCDEIKITYQKLLFEYQHPYKEKLSEVEQNLNLMTKELSNTEKKIATNVENNLFFEKEKLNFNSPQVIDAFLAENKSALFKVYAILVLICLLELAPIGLKMFLGQTSYGMEIESSKHLKKVKKEDEVFQAESNLLHRKQTSQKFAEYVAEMPSNHKYFDDLYKTVSDGEMQIISLKSAENAIKEMIETRDSIERMKHNNPRYSKEIDELYASMVLKPLNV